VLAGTARLSRRDRAALMLALECLRANRDLDTREALSCADLGRVADEIRVACCWSGSAARWRVQRARLALLLRLVLRCDAVMRKEPGASPLPTWRLIKDKWDEYAVVFDMNDLRRMPRLPRRVERIIPLWEQAPATKELPVAREQ